MKVDLSKHKPEELITEGGIEVEYIEPYSSSSYSVRLKDGQVFRFNARGVEILDNPNVDNLILKKSLVTDLLSEKPEEIKCLDRDEEIQLILELKEPYDPKLPIMAVFVDGSVGHYTLDGRALPDCIRRFVRKPKKVLRLKPIKNIIFDCMEQGIPVDITNSKLTVGDQWIMSSVWHHHCLRKEVILHDDKMFLTEGRLLHTNPPEIIYAEEEE